MVVIMPNITVDIINKVAPGQCCTLNVKLVKSNIIVIPNNM